MELRLWKAPGASHRGWLAGLGAAILGLSGLAMGPAGLAHASGALPDDRAYELISMPDKNFGEVVRVPRATDDGHAVLFGVSSGPEGSSGVHVLSYWAAYRLPDRWALQPVDAPGLARPAAGGPVAFTAVDVSPDLSTVRTNGGAPLVAGDFGAGYDIYDLRVGDPVPSWLSAPQGVAVAGTGSARYGASSADSTRVYFSEDNAALLDGAPLGALYEWRAGSLRIASIYPDGSFGPGRVAADAGLRSGTGGALFGGGDMAVAHRGAHAVSDDGSSVYWTDGAFSPIYLSRDGHQTVAVSKSHRAGHEGELAPANFVAASHDGSIAYLISPGQLTDDASSGMELYRYDAATDTLTLISAGASDASGGQVNYATTSDDATHVYFIANGALAPGAVSGVPNAYVWSGGQIRLVAPVDGGTRFVRLSDDGGQALLESEVSLAGAANGGHVAVYSYDAQSESITCISCRPDGAVSAANATVGEGFFMAPPANAPVPGQRTRNLTDDGRVFFMSKDQILPADVNHAYDVYEYEDGHLSLLSTGRSDDDSYLADNSDDGRDVFILTRSQLLESDNDEAYDLYDVRTGGGFPGAVAPARPCENDDCQKAIGPRPTLSSPGSTAASSDNALAHTVSVKRSVVLLPLSARQRQALERFGSAVLAVRITGGGAMRITATTAQPHGRNVGAATRVVRGTGTVLAHVRLRLSPAARHLLARRPHVTLRLQVHLPGARISSRTVTLLMTKAHR